MRASSPPTSRTRSAVWPDERVSRCSGPHCSLIAHRLVYALGWQRLPEMERLGHLLIDRLDGITAYCIHRVPFGLVESLNTTIKGVIRRRAA